MSVTLSNQGDDTMHNLLHNMFLAADLPTQPIGAREQHLIGIIKNKCLREYLELESIRYEVHSKDLELAYKQGITDYLEQTKIPSN